MGKSTKLVLLIFAFGIIIRLLYYPENVYFAFDQARDSFVSLELMKGDLKIVGPPSAASPNLFAGALLFYIYGPIYALFGKSPENTAFFVHIFNSFGIILTYLVASKLFTKKIGVISAFLFAISFEQTQYSLFISHQPMAVVSVLLFYLGLTLFIFQKQKRGLPLVAIGAGLSIQFHYSYVLLLPVALTLLYIHRKKLVYDIKNITLSAVLFLGTISTYLLAEVLFGFRSIKAIGELGSGSGVHLDRVFFIIERFVRDNFLASESFAPIIFVLFLAIGYKIYDSYDKNKLLLLSLWFTAGLIPYFLTNTPSYYYGATSSVSLIIIFAWFLTKVFSKNILLGIFILTIVITSNFIQIINQNPKGVTLDFVIQPGMHLIQEKNALDYMYKKANGKDFAVGGLTIPFYINTTWNYLFEWYGQETYGYVPVWIGPSAPGYPGNLEVVDSRSSLPDIQFIIKEPGQGIETEARDRFFNDEAHFTKVEEEVSFGTISVQKRMKI